MKDSYLLVGIRLSVFFKLLNKNKITYSFKNLLRLLFLFINAFWASLFAYIEKRKFGKKLLNTSIPDKPVIILGHWRTGSTLLHQLMSLDSKFVFPTLFQTTIPDSFLVSKKYYKPIMGRIMPKQRPMDSMKSGFDEPQEDEYATFRINGVSPLERLVFPVSENYFLADYNDNVDLNSFNKDWLKALILFCKKVVFNNNRNLLLKNPFFTSRVESLLEIFPNAKFIHIYREPLAVVKSTIRMWDIVGKQNALNNKWSKPTINAVAKYYSEMMNDFSNVSKTIKQGNICEIKYEDLINNPVEQISIIYKVLGLDFTKDFSQKITNYFTENKEYKINTHDFIYSEKNIVYDIMKTYTEKYGYE